LEERERSKAAVDRAVSQTEQIVQTKMEALAKIKDSANQRLLASLDLFLSNARSNLQMLMAPPEQPPPTKPTILDEPPAVTESVDETMNDSF
jgi:hypothetical protein